MYAVVDIKGFQYKLEQGETLRVPKFDVEVGKKIKIPEVLLISTDEDVSIGTPYVDGAVVEATVTKHDKSKKIIVFKKKRRKDYSVKKGHRQEYTEVVVDKISIKKAGKTAGKTKKAAEVPKTPKKEIKKTTQPKAKKAASPKPKAKKAASPKPKGDK